MNGQPLPHKWLFFQAWSVYRR